MWGWPQLTCPAPLSSLPLQLPDAPCLLSVLCSCLHWLFALLGMVLPFPPTWLPNCPQALQEDTAPPKRLPSPPMMHQGCSVLPHPGLPAPATAVCGPFQLPLWQ